MSISPVVVLLSLVNTKETKKKKKKKKRVGGFCKTERGKEKKVETI